MKIVNEKGKLFGIINIVDLLVILAVIAVIAGVGSKVLSTRIEEEAKEKVELTFVGRVRGVNAFIVENILSNDQTGKQMVSGDEYVDATIESVEVEDFIQQVVTEDGRLVNAVDPSKKDIVFTMKGVVDKDTPVKKIGVQEIRVGRGFFIKTDDLELSSTISSLQTADLTE